ncbi:uncharacterized protein AKAME5_002359800, partial [Lates japonicus]
MVETRSEEVPDSPEHEPEPSCVSFKSDRSKDRLIHFSEQQPPAAKNVDTITGGLADRIAILQGVLGMKVESVCELMNQCEDREEGVPPSKTTLCGEHESQTKAQSPESGPSCVSFKSDRSNDLYIDFK